MSSQENPRSGSRGPPAESYGPAPGQTNNAQSFHSTDMGSTQEVPRNPEQAGGMGYRGQGPITSQVANYNAGLTSLNQNEAQYSQGVATYNSQYGNLQGQRAKVESDIGALNAQVQGFNAQETTYLSEVTTFNETYGGRQLNPTEFSRAQAEQRSLQSAYGNLSLEQGSILEQQGVVSAEITGFNLEASQAGAQARALNIQAGTINTQANNLNLQAAGINSEISASGRPKPPPGGILGDIEVGAGYVYGAFNTGAKDVITAVGTGGREVASLYDTGKLENPTEATAQYLFEPVGPLPPGQTTAEVGASILGYSTPGVAIIKGVGEYNAPIQERAFDIGVGALSVAPFVGEASGLTAAGSAGARVGATLGNPVTRTALGAGISATGTAVSGGNPTQIGEAALIGGGVSYFGGEFAEGVGSRVQASAAAGRTATSLQDVGLVNIGTEQGPDVLATPEQAKLLGLDVGRAETFPGSQNYYTDRAPFVGNSGQVAIGSEVENVYATTEQAQNLGLSSGPTIGQRVAIGLTGGYEPATVPVGGIETASKTSVPSGPGTTTSTGEFSDFPSFPAKQYFTQQIETGKGVPIEGTGSDIFQFPSDTVSYQKGFEVETSPEGNVTGLNEFKISAGSGFEVPDVGEGPVPQISQGLNQDPIPLGGEIKANGMNPFLSERANTSSNLPFEDITSQPQPRTGPSGGSSLAPPPNYQRGGGVTETVYRLPPGVQSPGQRDLLFEQDFATTQNRASVFTTPGAQGQSPLGQTGFPEFAIFTSPSTGLQQVPGVQSQQSQAQVSAQVQQPSTSFSSFQIQQPSQVQEQQQNTQQIQGFAFESGFGASPFEGAPSKSGYPFPGFSLRTPPADRRLKGRKTNAYAFGINKNPVGNLLTLGTKAEKFDL